jgi:hypothetical protein
MWANHDAKYVWDKRLAHQDTSTSVWMGSVDRTQFEVVVHRVINNYFKHPSYYTIDGCPVFQIYDLKSLVTGLGGIEKTADALKWFREQVAGPLQP